MQVLADTRLDMICVHQDSPGDREMRDCFWDERLSLRSNSRLGGVLASAFRGPASSARMVWRHKAVPTNRPSGSFLIVFPYTWLRVRCGSRIRQCPLDIPIRATHLARYQGRRPVRVRVSLACRTPPRKLAGVAVGRGSQATQS